MKLLYTTICLNILAGFYTVHAQEKLNFGIGYNMGTHLKTGGLDFVIDRYNSTRSYLSKTMNKPRIFRGMNFSLDVYYEKYMMNMDWEFRKSDVSAEAAQTKQNRDFRYKINTFNIGGGVKLHTINSSVMGTYLGMDFSTISVKNYTRVYNTGDDKPNYQKINWELGLGFSPFVQFVGNRVTTKIYYQMMLNKINYWDVNNVINPNTWYNDEYDDNKGRTSSIGLCVRYNLFKNKD